MSPSGAEYIRQIKTQVEEVDPAQVSEHLGNGIVLRRRAREHRVGRGPHPRRQARAARVPRVADRGRCRRRPRPGDRPLLRFRAALGAGRPHADRPARLHEREVDDRRDHAVEGPRLQGRGPEGADPRAARALLAPPARAGDRARGPDQAAGGEGAAARRRRARLADRALPRRGGRRHARDRRRRRGRPLQPAAPGDPHDRRHRHAEGRLRRARDHRDQPGRQGHQVPGRASTPPTSWRSSRATT